MAIPNELNKDIDAIPEPSNRVLVRSLVLAVIALFSGVVALFNIGNGYRKRELENAKEIIKNERLNTDKERVNTAYWKAAYTIKDSLLNDCGNKRLEEGNQTKESLKRRIENTSEIKKLVK